MIRTPLVTSIGVFLLASACTPSDETVVFEPQDPSTAKYLDTSTVGDWPGYGRSFGQQHYTPLDQINPDTIAQLDLAWSIDLLPLKNSATQPIVADGIMYYATGLSVIHAVNAATGEELWQYDPEAAQKAGLNLRHGWGVRGISWWNDKIYTGTVDGRLIAVDAKTGTQVWSVQTFDEDFPAHINAAPRVYNGKVITGYASAAGATRGYVTTYDAETGEQLWRFYTVPGNPADGFENAAMEMAAETWSGEWWNKGGGGANVWNGISYDAETDTVFIGTGSAYSHNRRIRSEDIGDNLFVASIVALDGETGDYKWHYQTTPGDTWDFDAIMDMQLADLMIDGELRKVVMQAPKNGFFYVIDRITGELISAEPFAKVTWATDVDLETGRPNETPGARYPDGTMAEIWPTGVGARNWMPSAYNPKTGLVFLPKIEYGVNYTDRDIDTENWVPPTDRADDFGLSFGEPVTEAVLGDLVAWDPVKQEPVWSVPYPTMVNGGLLATGGDLVFQGTIDGQMRAYLGTTGEELWTYDAQAPLISTPISYSVDGEQYVTIITGLGMGLFQTAATGGRVDKYQLDARSQERRVLTFKLGGSQSLPAKIYEPWPYIEDPDFELNPAMMAAGQGKYVRHCIRCHGLPGAAAIQAPDLASSNTLLYSDTFQSIVYDGAFIPNGMPDFKDLTAEEIEEIRHFLRAVTKSLHVSNAAIQEDVVGKGGAQQRNE